MNGDWQVQLSYEPGQYLASITIWCKAGDKIQAVGSDDTVTAYDRGAAIPPTLRLQPDRLQALVDALVEKGIKPKDAGKTAGMLEATTKHLEDMRRLVFKE